MVDHIIWAVIFAAAAFAAHEAYDRWKEGR
jgi:hypothetical protein